MSGDRSFTAAEITSLLCPKPYTCGPDSATVPQEILSKNPRIKLQKGNYAGTALVSRCSGCDRLAVRRLNMSIPEYKAIYYTRGMTDVPGAGVIEGKGRRRNLLADTFLYGSKLGVYTRKDFIIVGEPLGPDINNQFPLADDDPDIASLSLNEQDDKNYSKNQCSHCGATDGKLLMCNGACGGVVQYCGKDCQVTHWKQRHKHECWKVAKTNTFTVPNPKLGKPDVPLRALRQLDGFGKPGVCIYYSNHLGDESTRYFVEEIFGEVDEESMKEIQNVPYCVATSPIYDEVDRELLRPGEACFNISKNKEVFDALVRNNIISVTDKTLQIGMYPTMHPVCRINLPLYVENDSDD